MNTLGVTLFMQLNTDKYIPQLNTLGVTRFMQLNTDKLCIPQMNTLGVTRFMQLNTDNCVPHLTLWGSPGLCN